MPASPAKPRRSLWRRLPVIPFALAIAVFGGLAVYMRAVEHAAIQHPAINDQLTASGQPRPLAAVSQALREMKLVTVEIDTTVTSTTGHDSWRGDVAATVKAPVKILYGTDLSRLSVDALAYSPLSRAYIVRIPTPERISTEICTEAEGTEIQVGWMRLRSRAGEYYLGQARKDLHARAQELTLSPEDAAFVRRTTREQVENLIRKIVGGKAPVTVAFEDGQ